MTEGRFTEGNYVAMRASRPASPATAISEDPVVAAVERLLVGGIGVTALAIAGTSGAAEMTLAQWRVLIIVAGGDGVRIGELASRLGVAVPSASRLVRRLEIRGLVAAERDERDRRATLVRETPIGHAVREAVMRRRAELIDEALDGSRAKQTDGTLAALAAAGDALARFA